MNEIRRHSLFAKKILLALVLLPLLVPSPGEAKTTGNGESVWKIATLAPKNVGWARHAEELIVKETIRMSGGAVRPVVYWGGSMGDDEDYLAKMRTGQLDGAGLSGQGAGLACPEFAVLELPFLFNDYAEVDFVRKRMFDRFDALFSAYGLKLLYWLDQDFDQIYSSKNAMARLEDFKSLRFVLWYGPIEESLFNALSADWVPLNVPESARALRTGTANATIGPATWMVAAQLAPVLKYVNPVRVRYSPVVIVITREAWQSLPEEIRAAQEAGREGIQERFVERARADNRRSLDALVSYGVAETRMEPEELARFKERAMEVYGQMSGILFTRELLDAVKGNLSEFRRQNPAR